MSNHRFKSVKHKFTKQIKVDKLKSRYQGRNRTLPCAGSNDDITIILLFYLDNEWKTRFQTQEEMNKQLEKQVVILRDKLGQLKIPSRDGKIVQLSLSF